MWGNHDVTAGVIRHLDLGAEMMPKRYQQRRINRRLKRKNRKAPNYYLQPKDIRAAKGYPCKSAIQGGPSLEKWLAMIDAGLDPNLEG